MNIYNNKKLLQSANTRIKPFRPRGPVVKSLGPKNIGFLQGKATCFFCIGSHQRNTRYSTKKLLLDGVSLSRMTCHLPPGVYVYQSKTLPFPSPPKIILLPLARSNLCYLNQGKYPPPWGGGGGISANVIWGKKYEKRKRKRGKNVKEKGRKGKEKGRRGKE